MTETPLYRKIVTDPSFKKFIKILVILKILRVKKSLYWSCFFALNKLIRFKLLQLNNYINDQQTVEKIANVITCSFLYLATVDNSQIPKDYTLLYLIINYFCQANPPTSKIVLDPGYSKYLKLSTYEEKSPLIKKLYQNKEFLIFPALYAQLLSNYLTPTKYRLNHKYLSSFIKRRIFNPIWINFSLGVDYNRLNWISLIRTYLFQNILLIAIFGLYKFKTLILDKLYEIKYQKSNQKEAEVLKDYSLYVFHKVNSFMNFVYCPNLISILLIALTSPVFKSLTPSGKSNWFQKYYLNNTKSFFKNYTKIIGFIAGFFTVYFNSINLIPDYGMKQSSNARTLTKSFFNDLNLYLFRVILLSKWRIVKSNHPVFKLFGIRNYNVLETVLMCFGVYKYMELNDYLKSNKDAQLSSNSIVKFVDFVNYKY